MGDIIGKISTFKFLLIIIICIAGFALFHLLYSFLMNQLKASGRSHRNIRLLENIRRLVALILMVVVAVAFILINPMIHVIILALITILGYDSIKNLIIGIILQQEFNLSEGRTYKIGLHEGVLQRKSWTGFKLSSKGNLVFVPYTMAYRDGISVKNKTSSYIVHLRCTLKEDQKVKTSEEHIKSLLFPLPYLIEGSVPQVHAEGRYIHMEVGLNNSKYVNSLTDLLNSNDYQTQILDKQ